MFFRRMDHNVELVIDAKLGTCDGVYSLKFTVSDQEYAELLVRHLKNLIRTENSELMKSSYNRGWADAKAKRKKEL